MVGIVQEGPLCLPPAVAGAAHLTGRGQSLTGPWAGVHFLFALSVWPWGPCVSPRGRMLPRVSRTQGTCLRVRATEPTWGQACLQVRWGVGGLRVRSRPPLPSHVYPDRWAGYGFAPLAPTWAGLGVACQVTAGGGSPRAYQDLPLYAGRAHLPSAGSGGQALWGSLYSALLLGAWDLIPQPLGRAPPGLWSAGGQWTVQLLLAGGVPGVPMASLPGFAMIPTVRALSSSHPSVLQRSQRCHGGGGHRRAAAM